MIFFKILLGIATISIIIFNIVKGFTSTTSKEEVLKYLDSEITISKISASSVVIDWQSEESEIGSVQYGIIKDVYYQSTTEQVPTHIHAIRLESLSECTKYYFEVTSESMLFDKENGSFTTLCENAKIHKTNNSKGITYE